MYLSATGTHACTNGSGLISSTTRLWKVKFRVIQVSLPLPLVGQVEAYGNQKLQRATD